MTEQRGSTCRVSSELPLRLFEDLPAEFDPSTWWLDGKEPEHPHFNEAATIDSLVKITKGPLLSCVLEGCGVLLARTGQEDLVPSLRGHLTLWRASISLHKYGVVYLGTRSECRSEFLPAIEARPEAFEAIDAFLRQGSNVIRVINYGVHRFFTGTTAEGVRVTHPGKFVPPNAVASIGPFHVAVRPQDFEGDSASRLDVSRPLWDLHDFAHQTATSLCPALFGCKYFTSLVRLPYRLTALISSPGMEDLAPAVKCSDGLVFSKLLTPLFAREAEQCRAGQHTYATLVTVMAERLADYLQGRCELEHASTGARLKMSAPITPTQLAVLAQNKAYELTASEIEQRVMTRGGPEGDGRDDLDGLGAAARIRFLARCRRWLYFEVRNTTKHRAHKLAYRIVAKRLLDEAEADGETRESENSKLLRMTLDMLEYKGWDADEGEVPNLWQALAENKDKGNGV